MLTRADLDYIFDVRHFIHHGTFALENSQTHELYRLADIQCGEVVIILSFHYVGYDIAVLIDTDTNSQSGHKTTPYIKSYQIEQFHHAVLTDSYLTKFATYTALLVSQVSELITEAYEDKAGQERVVFLSTGVMLYYQKSVCLGSHKEVFYLSLILGDHVPSKVLVRECMRRVQV